jgi:hypothetical protein
VPEDSWPPDQDVEPENVDELLTLLLRRGATHLVYRGQRDYDWPLVCTLSRALREEAQAEGHNKYESIESMVVDPDFNRHVDEVETRLLRAFMEQAKGLTLPDLPDRTDRLAWWELMQHHRAPTRLLDWTRSPFVGLWFAFWDQGCDRASDAALWIFDTRNSSLNHPREGRAASIPGWDNFLDDRDLQNRLAEKAIADNALVPLAISPRVAVPRVIAQQSVLTLVPNIGAPTHYNHFVLKTFSTRIRLRSSWKPRVLDLCRNMGITRAALFRDLDSIGDALKETLTVARL